MQITVGHDCEPPCRCRDGSQLCDGAFQDRPKGERCHKGGGELNIGVTALVKSVRPPFVSICLFFA
jgi:hypothetical protein